MICKNCGYQVADDSAFCINCGNPVEAQPKQDEATQPMYTQYVEPQTQPQVQYAQPQYQQPQYIPQPQVPIQPQYAPQPQYYVQPQYVYDPPMSREYTEFIDRAGSVMSRSITSLVLTCTLGWIYGVGILIGFIMTLTVKGTIGKLKRIDINEDELVTQKNRSDYAAAQRKIKTARIISTINLIFVLIPIIALLFVFGITFLGVGLEMY